MRELLARLFQVDFLKGLAVTFRAQNPKNIVTEQYPLERPMVAERYRGAPRLNNNPETGETLCIGCNLCALACPENLIVVGWERDDATRRKVLTTFTYDTSRCMFCGLCEDACPLEPAKIEKLRSILTWPAEGAWQVRVLPHPEPLYHVEAEPARLAEGMYDKMGALGAHEVVVETPLHDKRMSQFSDEEIERVLWVWASRIADLKKDSRFKYISLFKNQGVMAGEEWPHAHSQVTATIFVPRRIKYELSSAHEWFKDKERCIFCDMVRQEEKLGKRIVDVQGDYYALCPYASRVPYEIWLLHRRHNHLFEQPRPGSNRRQLAALLGRVLRRLEKVAPAFHLVVHTSPNTKNKKGELAGYWKTLPDDYHWHIEILPIVEKTSKSYSIKEVYFNAELPEQAAANLRALDPNS